jgi:hypothetical protein
MKVINIGRRLNSMLNCSNPKVEFVIDLNYLITHTLVYAGRHDFSSKKFNNDIESFQNYAWSKSKVFYDFLAGRPIPGDLNNKNLSTLAKGLQKYLEIIKKSKEYGKILLQTQNYLKFCKTQWENNFQRTSKIIKDLTGFKFKNERFIIYVTHPSLRNGVSLGGNKIAFGNTEDWRNYSTVYLWHEILHSKIPFDGYASIGHAIIDLVADEELRISLNGGYYPPFIGNPDYSKLKKQILPYWKKYLVSDKKDILKFYRHCKKNLKIR